MDVNEGDGNRPVLCLQGAGQVFSVGVTEGVGQTVLVTDLFAVGFGLWGAFTLRYEGGHTQSTRRRSLEGIETTQKPPSQTA